MYDKVIVELIENGEYEKYFVDYIGKGPEGIPKIIRQKIPWDILPASCLSLLWSSFIASLGLTQ